jgi:hypothetical protein
LLGVAVILVIVIAIVALQSRFGEQTPVVPEETTVETKNIVEAANLWL